MPIQKCTFKSYKTFAIKCSYKSVRLNDKAKVYDFMARQKCTFKWHGTIVRLDLNKTLLPYHLNVRLLSCHLNGKTFAVRFKWYGKIV